MNTLTQWLNEQTKLGRHLYLVLDSDGQLDERNALAGELVVEQYRNLYLGTPADSLAAVGPYIFQLDTAEHPPLKALFSSPERHWGWLASSASGDLEALTRHWQARLVTGQRPNQALYRFHDNRVLARALAYLQPEQRPDYLGPLISVCYWQAEQWVVTDNPVPGDHPLPLDPAWVSIPQSEATTAGVQFDNTRRYLMRDHTDAVVSLAKQQDVDTWLRGQLDCARTWGWHKPDHIHFLLTQSLQAPGYAPPSSWTPRPSETPAAHFERVYQEKLYWQGDASV
ncbi:hypothetical protein J2X66_000271 [Pseudomonas sp. 3296]|jgi:hypothetical protein|uniref:DUF4123 domain-containing protein n=1 Tax=Pseudomonas sp. 3296 TaxID=2817753 RepID=UPI00285F28CA|nr:DUF4123 domain-containing protein [Pseudomonas sp. 3296]MDR6913424.1 hypothetical protein [Pseudomonas sp. 3296]